MNIPTLAGLSLRDLEYAVAVARHRHFGRAALQCGVSQPALSEQVRKLEALLGVVLFERGRRNIMPTARGEPLLRQAEGLVAAARALMEAARASAEPMTGEVQLGVISTLGPYYVPSVLRDVRAAFPGLQLRLREGQTAALMEALRLGELDAVLLALPVDAEGLVVEPLFVEPFHLACPADHRLAAAAAIRLADLHGPDLLLLEDGHCLRDQTLGLCGGRGIERHTRFASSLEMLRHMIAAGEGYSLFPLLALDARYDSELMVHRPLDDPRAGRTIGLVWRASEPRGDDFRALAEHLRRKLPEGLLPAA